MNAREIVSALGGRWHGSYGFVRCVAHEDKKPSLRVRDGDKPGLLLVKCHAGCQTAHVLDELKRRGLTGGVAQTADVGDEVRRQRAERDAKAERSKLAVAERIIKQCRPAAGTIVERYLRLRGIVAPIPPTLLFHYALRSPETQNRHPGMVARVERVDQKVCGIHRTLLIPPGRKAPGVDCKFSLGPIGGGAVRLAPAAEEMAISEGIETGLSFMQIYGIPTWAALSTAGIEKLILPPLPVAKIVHIALDIDPKRGGEKAARIAAERFEKEGREVRFDRPPLGCKDFNDALVCNDAA